MGVGRRIMLAFAMCAANGTGPRQSDIEAQSVAVAGHVPGGIVRGESHGARAACRIGRTTGAVLAAGAMMSTVMALVMMADGHRSFRITFRHLGVLFNERAVQRLVRDPFLVGAGLCVLAVLGFVLVTLALISPASPVRPAVRRALTTGQIWMASRPTRRPRVRRPASVARRPRTLRATRPDTRPVTRKRVLGRAKG